MRTLRTPADAVAAIAVAVAALLVLAVGVVPAQAGNHADRSDRTPTEGERPTEVPAAGEDRYATAAQVATAAFEQAETIVLATGQDYADGLTGASLAGALDAPILLVPGELRDGELPDDVLDAIDELGAASGYLLGGPDAIGEDVAAHLESVGGLVLERVAGESRFDTALEIALAAVAQDPAAGEIEIDGEQVRAAFLATGRDFPDAVAAGPGAFARGVPMLLTDPDELHPAAVSALEDLDIEHVLALGGERAVSEDVLAEVAERVGSVERLDGPSRWDTAVEVAERLEGEGFGFDAAHVGLATGLGFADALAAAPYLGSAEAPLLLADERPEGELPDAVAAYLSARGCEIEFVHVLGGEDAVGQGVREAALELARCLTEEAPGEPEPGAGDDGDDEDGGNGGEE